MFKIKKNAGIAMIVCATMVVSAPMAFAATTLPPTTDVIYNNADETVIPGENGLWGVAIPSTIHFKDEDLNKAKAAKIKVVPLGGRKLDDFTRITISGSVASKNGYKLISQTLGGEEPAYAINIDGKTFDTTTGTADTSFQNQFGKGTPLSSDKLTLDFSATLKAKATKLDTYVDLLTFTFNGTSELR